MAWQRRNGRLVRGNDSTLVALPQRVRRRRAKPKPQQRIDLRPLPVDVAHRSSPSSHHAMRCASSRRQTRLPAASSRYCFEHLNTCAVDVTQSLNLMRSFVRVRAPLRSLTVHLGSQEVPMLRWLLESCDTTNLSRMRVKVFRVPLLKIWVRISSSNAPERRSSTDDKMISQRRRWMTSAASCRGPPPRAAATGAARASQPRAGLVRRRRRGCLMQLGEL